VVFGRPGKVPALGAGGRTLVISKGMKRKGALSRFCLERTGGRTGWVGKHQDEINHWGPRIYAEMSLGGGGPPDRKGTEGAHWDGSGRWSPSALPSQAWDVIRKGKRKKARNFIMTWTLLRPRWEEKMPH